MSRLDDHDSCYSEIEQVEALDNFKQDMLS
jgi:hypothetical protein